MGVLVDDEVSRSVDTLRSRSLGIADAIIASHDAIDALHLQIEDRCMHLMATQQPVAEDLRMIAAVWAMTIDLDPIADDAEDNARRVRRMAAEPLLKPLIDIPRMADIVGGMLREGLDAFVRRDVALAERVAAADDDVDHLYSQVHRELLTYMIDDPKTSSVRRTS